MLVHTVFFWLNAGLKSDDVKKFQDGAKSLTTIPSVVHGWVGTPSSTDRPVIDRSYSYALTVVFHDMDGHDAYQVHPIHLAFLDNCKHLWGNVKIYDADVV